VGLNSLKSLNLTNGYPNKNNNNNNNNKNKNNKVKSKPLELRSRVKIQRINVFRILVLTKKTFHFWTVFGGFCRLLSKKLSRNYGSNHVD
jgi:hypothetical protein